jgi:predicted RNA-binding protein with PIN domain
VAKRSIVLDGYNLMFRGSPPDGASLADAREVFLRRVDAARGAGEDVTVVFDGRAAPGRSGPVAAGLKVVFARRPKSADDRIVEIVSKSPRGQVVVLTYDRELRHRVRTAGGQPGDPDAFFRRPEVPRPRKPRGVRKPPPPSGAELAEWERLFEERDPEP